jgi:hypothetical protein
MTEESIKELEQRLRRLEKKLRGLVAEGSAGPMDSSTSDYGSYSVASRGSWTAADSQRLNSGATSEAMAAIEAKRSAAAAAELPSRPDRKLGKESGEGGQAPAIAAVSSAAVDQTVEGAVEKAVAQAIARQLQALDLEDLVHAAVVKRLESLDLRALLLEEARTLLDGDRLRALVADTLKDGTLLDGKTPEQLTQDALAKIFDDDGEDSLLEKAMIKALKGRRPEDVLSAKVGELFDRFSKRVGG